MIKELIQNIEIAGFIDSDGGSLHRNFEQPCGTNIILSGKKGDNAKRYQEKEDKT